MNTDQALQALEAAQAFKMHTKLSRDGTAIRCRKGLRAVSAPTKEQALKEAQHYFLLYWLDGEYSQ